MAQSCHFGVWDSTDSAVVEAAHGSAYAAESWPKIAAAGLLTMYERLIANEKQLADLYTEAERIEDERERRYDHPTCDMARDDVIRYPRTSLTTAVERDATTDRDTRPHDHERDAR
jgi:hypothetical protein